MWLSCHIDPGGKSCWFLHFLPMKHTKLKTSLKIKNVIKRDGEIVSFDLSKIKEAALKAMTAVEEGTEKDAQMIADLVQNTLFKILEQDKKFVPNVEQLQDLVEETLILSNYSKTAKAYILYRKERADLRALNLEVTKEIRKQYAESSKYFRNQLSEVVYYISYSRWIEEKGRRETWVETVQRFMDFMKENLKDKLTKREYEDVHDAILNQDIVPSMRLFWSSGDAARDSNVTAYNCSFVAPTRFKDFGEIMYISMCGCGVGFSVEEKTVEQLPVIQEQTGKKHPVYVVPDSKEGWADALVKGMEIWFAGEDIHFDFSQIRPQGARLKTMGGRASGPKPLIDLLDFTKEKILSRQGKKLSTLDVHDICCKIGEIVIAGGVRRSAMISLSDLNDMEMRNAKQGQFWNTDPHRVMANNSVVYENKPELVEFMEEWLALIKSGSGERGIFNRGGLQKQLPARRIKVSENYLDNMGTNPCGEILLRSRQFCNLTSVVIRAEDDEESLTRKMKLATIVGTYQATLTKFKYLSSEWKKNCEEEALLGVSFTGYFDNKRVRDPKMLSKLRDESVKANKKYAARFGINDSTCVTCVKPSGNSSQLLDTASGMHPRYAQHYIRRVRISNTDPILKMLKDQGVPCNPEVGQTEDTATTFVLEFPVAAPKGSVFKDDLTAVELLEHWLMIKQNFTEHNPSATIYVGADEWVDVQKWVYDNWEEVGGLTFLQRSDHVYQLAPYEEIDKAKYTELKEAVKNVDFSKLVYYENTDKTTGAKELACVGGACEL